MTWPMPPTGPWGPGIGVTPDMNIGTYTAEQWAAMQQQNWQQWTQWQQQYASWQSQYGNRYAAQMHAMQTMGTVPPLPPTSTAPPPAPPPPDKPPPPPHENNQPLFGNTQQASVPNLPSVQNSGPLYNNTESTGNTQNRAQATDACPETSVNSEALKTLAEEQKAFDIQFQQWEEEFEKWKKANINHPDKKTYKEYEQTFEACKARLLERRLQMNQKKAKLMNNAHTTNVNSTPRVNVPTPIPEPIQSKSSSNYVNNEQSSYSPQNYDSSFALNSQSNIISQHYYKGSNNKNFEPQDRQESYSKSNTTNNIISSNLIPTEPFIPASEPPKGIPGLDLVPEIDKFASKMNDIIDITDESLEKQQFRNDQQEPDYSKISKGINNILGDETIMNILSMVRGQGTPQSHSLINNQNPQGSYGATDSSLNRPNNYLQQNEPYSDNYGMVQNQNIPSVKQHSDYAMNQENNQGSKYSTPPPRLYQNRQDGLLLSQTNERNQQYKSQGLLPRPGTQENVRHNIPMHSLLEPAQAQNDYAGREFERRIADELHLQPNLSVRPNIAVRPSPTVRPKWVEDPLFTPSIIVEYEHKSLRLKGRDFIEPVHTFDYNHQSKDSDVKKKDFEKEAEELFTRNPRISERENRHNSDKYSKDLYHRNNERASNKEVRDFRDDPHSRGFREDYEERRRFDDDKRRFDDDVKDRRFEERRRDDRDKYYRREDIYRDRDKEEMFRERERDLERIRSRDRDRDRDRDMDRNRDIDRNRERDRERPLDQNRDRDRERGLDQNRERDRERGLDQNREREREIYKNKDFRRSRSNEKDNRKRALSRDSELSNSSSKKVKDNPVAVNSNGKPKHTIMIDDILELPGRQMRPEKIVIILRGPPGSGKSYLAKLIRDREAEQGGTVRVMSIDDYFMQEGELEEKDPATGKTVKKPSLQYEYDEKQEETYLSSLKRAFKRSLTDGYFTFLIYDAVNDQLRSYADIWNFARQCGFQVYICTMDLDSQTCFKRNIHNRKLEEIEVISSRFFPTPDHHIQLDPTTLLQSASIPEVQMEDADDDVTMEDAQESEVNSSFTSKWEKMEDAAQLARLDGTSKPLRPSQLSMEDYLQLDDWKPNTSKPGKKTVRWADIEERRQQEKMRAIGFVVGQTDWNRMTDPTMGSSALTQTKYIERVRRT